MITTVATMGSGVSSTLIISSSFELFQDPTVTQFQEVVAMSVFRLFRTVSVVTGVAAVILSAAALFSACSSGKPSYPFTEKRPLTDEYYGVKVVDDYRWLDDLSDPKVRAWNDAQNQLTRSVLDKVPARSRLYERLKAIVGENSSSYFNLIRRSKLFALKQQPPKDQPFIVALVSPDEPTGEKVVVDPNQRDAQGTTAIDFFVPSRDGRLLAVCMSKNGSEDGSVYVFDVETGKQLADVVPRVQYPTGGGSVAWNKDASGFYYTRYPQGNERPKEDLNFYQQIYYHKLGTPPSEDAYVIGKEFPRIAEIQLTTSNDGTYLLATVANGDGGEYAHYLLMPSGRWIQITQFSDEVTLAEFGKDGRLYLLAHKNTPRGKILATPLVKPELSSAREIVPESDAAIESFLPTTNFVYVNDMIGGPSRIRLFDLKGTSQGTIPSPAVASVGSLVDLGADGVLYGQETYLVPFAFYHYDPATRNLPKNQSLHFVERQFRRLRGGQRACVVQGWDESADQYHPEERDGSGRQESDHPVRLRWIWCQYGTLFLLRQARVVGPRRALLYRQSPWGRRIRRGVAQSRQAYEKAECLR